MLLGREVMRIAFTHNLQTEANEAEAEFDTHETVDLIMDGLTRLGHDVWPIEVGCSLPLLMAELIDVDPDLVFNTAEGTGDEFRESFYPALFARLDIPFVGSNAYVCALTLDKWLTKLVVASRGVMVPAGALVKTEEDLAAVELPYPVIVKPNFEGSSKGITLDSIAHNRAGMEQRVRALLARFPAGVLVEQYIDGMDVVVPFIEGVAPETGGVLEPASYAYQPRAGAMVYDFDMKQNGYGDLRIDVPAAIDPITRQRVITASQRAYQVLGIRDFGRIDFRVARDGTPYFLEVNALPSLESGASLYLCGRGAGLQSVDAVLQAIIDSACCRQNVAAFRDQVSVA